MYLEDDSTWGFKRIYHGITFQELLIVISLMHEMDITSLMSKMGKECSFSIDTELESAQGFDDIVVWHEQNKDIVHKFIQVKHNQDGTKKISVSSLLTKSGKFSILKLFLAYLKIKNSAKFSDGIKHFLFATNMDLDSPYSIQHEVRNLRAMLSGENKGKELSFVRIDTKDEFLDIGDSARYRISDSDGSVAQYLKQNMDFIKREIGKEVSNKEIEDFLNELVFVVNLPHEAQLRELLLGKLSSRLNKKFDYIGDNQIFCNNLLKKISDWVKDIKARPLSYKEGEELFREVELWASTLGKIEEEVKKVNEKADRIEEKVNRIGEEVADIYRLMQEVNRLKLQEKGREEEILRKSLELINNSNIEQKNVSHIASVWGYVSTHGKLIDDFYFNSSYMYRGLFSTKKITPLHFLAVSGDCGAVSEIIKHVERHYPGKLVRTVNVEDDRGQTPLHQASYNGNFSVVKYLISKGADVNARSENDWVPLHLASYNGELDVVKYLINKGADVNTTELLYHVTPLHLAAYHGKLSIIKYLISEGADVNARDRSNWTPIHRAAHSGKLDVVKYLISKGAEINAKSIYNDTPLHLAVYSGMLDVVVYLVSQDAEINAKSRYGGTPLSSALYRAILFCSISYFGKSINTQSKVDSTSLDLAVENYVYTMEYLVEKGGSFDTKNGYNKTLSHCYASGSGSLIVVEYLVNRVLVLILGLKLSILRCALLNKKKS